MKTSRLLLWFLLPLTLWSREFPDLLPAGSILYVESTNLAATREKMKSTPFADLGKDLDWKQIVLAFYDIGISSAEAQLDLEEGEVEDTELTREELGSLLEKMEQRWTEIRVHLQGSAAFSLGDFQKVAALLRAHEPLRKELYPEGMDLEDADPEDPAWQTILAREMEMDELEGAAILEQFRVWVEVADGDALRGKLITWLTEWVQEQEESEEPLELVRLDWQGKAVIGLTGKTDPDENPATAEDNRAGLWWCITDGVWLIALTEEGLRDSLTLLQNPPVRSLASTPRYRDSDQAMGPRDQFMYLDLSAMDGLLRGFVPAEPAPQPGGVEPGKILDFLGLDALLPIVTASSIETDGIRVRSRMGFSRETALSRLLVDPVDAPAPSPPFLHKDFGQFNSFHWGLSRFWSALEKELLTLSPQTAAGFGAVRMLGTMQLGIDPKVQFLDHLDSGVVMVQQFDAAVMEKMLAAQQSGDPDQMLQVSMEHPTSGQNYLIGFQMKNPEAISSALNTLMSRLHPQGLPEPEMFKDHPIVFPMPAGLLEGQMRQLVSYTQLDGYLLFSIGNVRLLQQAITASREADMRVWNQPDLQRLRDRLPAQAQFIEYSSGSQQQDAIRIMQMSLSSLNDHAKTQLPDLSRLGKLIRQSMGVTVRKGLVFESEGLMEFNRDL